MLLRLLLPLLGIATSTLVSPKDNSCPAGGCDHDDEDVISALQVGRVKKNKDDASTEEMAEAWSSKEEEEEFLRELYQDESNLPTEEDWWVPFERMPAYLQEFHRPAKATGDEIPPYFDTSASEIVMKATTSRRHKGRCGPCNVNEEGINLFFENCSNPANGCCGKGCYLWNGPCSHAPEDWKTVYLSDLVMPRAPLQGVERVTADNAKEHDHVWPDAGHWYTPAIPVAPYKTKLKTKYGWAHILNPYTARTSHQMHIAVRKLKSRGKRLVHKLDKKLKKKPRGTFVDCRHDFHACKYCQAAMFDEVPGAFSEALKLVGSCNGCLGDMLIDPENRTTIGTVGISLLYAKDKKGKGSSLAQLDSENSEDEEEDEEEDDSEDQDSSDDGPDADSLGSSRGRDTAVLHYNGPNKGIGGGGTKVSPIILFTSSGSKPCSIKYSIS